MNYPLGNDPLDGKPCETCPDYATNCGEGCTREGDGHDSDCETHDAPAYPAGECDCSARDDVTQYNPWRAHIYAVMEGGSYFSSQDWNDLLAYMCSEHKKIISLDEQVRQLEIDSERLEWLMRNVSGKEFRRLGVTYGGNCERDRIDAAMKTHNVELTGRAAQAGE